MSSDIARSADRAASTAGEPSAPRPVGRRVAVALMKNALPIGFVGLIVLFVGVGAPNFMTFENLRDVARLSAAIMVVAVPMTFLMIMGHVDLSVGSTLAASAVTAGLLMTVAEVNPALASLAGMLVGALIGFANGFAVNVFGLSPIVTTLGMLTAVRGAVLIIAPRPVYDFPDAFVEFGIRGPAGLPWLVLLAAIVVVVGFYALSLAPVGRHVMAIGVNDEAAYLSGINVRRTLWSAYIITGAAAGLAGVMWAAQLNSAPSGTLGAGFELDVLTAVLLGGVAFNGGRGTIGGVVLGVLFLGLLTNGLTLLAVPAAVAMLIKGGSLVVAALLDRATQKAESRVGERR